MLRNAFDLVATETTLRNILRAVTFAKTTTDQLRAIVDSGTISATSYFGNTTGVAPAPYALGAPNAHDSRELMMQTTQAAFNATIQQRWNI